MKIALVVMPWVGVEIPPLGVASLKAVLEAEGFEVDCLYLNVRMLARVGPLDSIFLRQGLWTEWLFGYHLFGPGGTGELSDTLEDLNRLASFRAFTADAGLSQERLERLVEKDIPDFLRDCLEGIAWSRYGLIGFSSVFWSQTACLKLAKEIKARLPRTPIAFGGSNVEGDMGIAALKGCEWIDYVVDGEGEEAFLALARDLRDGKPHETIPRVSFRRGAEIVARDPAQKRLVDMTRLPEPDHDDFYGQLKSYGVDAQVETQATFEASRGCWWGQKQHCTFCGLNGQAMTFRAKKPQAVVQTILNLYRKHRVVQLRACDNILALDHLRELVPLLARARKEEGLDWNIFFEAKANLTEAQMRSFAEAGILSLEAGIESFSTPILRLMRKGSRGIQNIQTLKLAAASGIDFIWNILSGFPGEDPAEYDLMAERALALTHLEPPYGVAAIRIDRFSPYHFDWRNFGIKKPKPQMQYQFIYPDGRFSAEEIAYYFDFDHPGKSAEKTLYTARLRETVDFWRRIWARNFFAYVQGIGFVTVYDSRPLTLGGGIEFRQHHLSGVEARVFSFCRTIKSFGEILAACRQIDAACDERAAREILARMVERRWLYREENQYVNLAVPVAKMLPAQKVAFDKMNQAKREWQRQKARVGAA